MAHVIESWGEIQKIPNYEQVAGLLLFQNIFTIEPAAQHLFSFGADYPLKSPELFEDPRFIKHSIVVIEMVTAAIQLLKQGEMKALIGALQQLGARHASYNVIPEHYPLVGEALIATLEAALGDAFTDSVKRDWIAVADLIFSTMCTTW